MAVVIKWVVACNNYTSLTFAQYVLGVTDTKTVFSLQEICFVHGKFCMRAVQN